MSNRIDGRFLGMRCQVLVHRPPYTQADRGQCARWATHDVVELAAQPYQHRCTQHTPRRLRVPR